MWLCSRHLINNRIFFQHPDMMRMLRIHENVMTVMMNILGSSVQLEEESEALTESGEPKAEPKVYITIEGVIYRNTDFCLGYF